MNIVAPVPTVEPAQRRPRVVHIYPGYEFGHVVPPAGAKALCGYVRRSSAGRAYRRSDAAACVVCCDLWDNA